MTMGAYDGAEVCELVGLYLLPKLETLFGKGFVGLYRDDGRSATHGRGQDIDRKRKKLVEIFKMEGLKITVESGLSQVDFLDVTMDLKSNKFFPYRKPDDEPLYINAKSSHPPNVIKNLPANIMDRISRLSCNDQEYEKAKVDYEKALKSSGFIPPAPRPDTSNTPPSINKRTRHRNVIWFNPPFSLGVESNIARITLQLLDHHFPKHHKYHKLFNRKNVKVSYSCTDNIKRIISKHNAKLLSPPAVNEGKSCNCSKNAICPLQGKCLTECVVYKATVKAKDSPTKHYFGLTEGSFKTRYTQHLHSFRNENRKTATALSSHIWMLKEKNIQHEILWEIARRASPYRCGTRRCDLCLTEKLVIATSEPNSTLNEKAEIVSTCRHRTKFRLSSI